MEEKGGLQTFFKYMGLGFLISSLKTDISGLPMLDVVRNLFVAFMYNLVIGIWIGLSWMFGTDLYLYIKKNTKNEQYRF